MLYNGQLKINNLKTLTIMETKRISQKAVVVIDDCKQKTETNCEQVYDVVFNDDTASNCKRIITAPGHKT